jgi:hypothetical protein
MGKTRNSAGNATSQDSPQDCIQTPVEKSARPLTRMVEINDTMQDMKMDNTKGIATVLKRAGSFVMTPVSTTYRLQCNRFCSGPVDGNTTIHKHR